MKKIFNTTQSDLVKYNGTEIEVIRPLTSDEEDLDDVGNMYKIRMYDGFIANAYEDELTNIKMQAWLVYEVNDICYADIPFCSTLDMEVFDTKEEALEEMKKRKEKYITEDNDWELSDETETCITFDDMLKEGSFDIRLIQLA